MVSESDLCSSLLYWKRTLNLVHWKITLHKDEPRGKDNTETDAGICAHDHYLSADLYFYEGWREWDQRYLDRVVVHELVHLIVHDLAYLPSLHVNELLPAKTAKLLESVALHYEERLVEHLAQVFVEAFQR